MDDFETKKKELLQPLMFEAGAALMDCQAFEFAIALLLFHLSRLGAISLDFQKVGQILDNTDKKTAGQLIDMFKKHFKVSDDSEKALESALEARNRIIHRVLIDNVEQFIQPEKRAALIKEISNLRRTVRKVDEMLRPALLSLGELVGVDHKAMEAEVRQLFQ